MYSVVRFFPVLLLVKNQAAGNSKPSIVYFLKAEAVRREIRIKTNFVGARPIKIIMVPRKETTIMQKIVNIVEWKK